MGGKFLSKRFKVVSVFLDGGEKGIKFIVMSGSLVKTFSEVIRNFLGYADHSFRHSLNEITNEAY